MNHHNHHDHHDHWDLVVIGAGPAGSVAARAAARAGRSVLLLDKAAFPRQKVCGGCLNPRAIAALESAGLGAIVPHLGAPRLERLALSAGGARASVRLRGGVAVSRAALDSALIEAARTAGVTFQAQTRGELLPVSDPDDSRCESGAGARIIRLHPAAQPGAARTVSARLVLLATGLQGGHSATPEAALQSRAQNRSLFGVGALLAAGSAADRPRGEITMACGRGGYVGLVGVEADRLDIAAALEPRFVRTAGGPGAAIHELLASCLLTIPTALAQADWQATPALTRAPQRVWGRRVLLIGDAAGYVEPFTGEGMAWALESALAVGPLLSDAIRAWDDQVGQAWAARHAALIGARRGWCRRLAWGLRRPALVRLAVGALRMMPRLAEPVVRALSTPRVAGG